MTTEPKATGPKRRVSQRYQKLKVLYKISDLITSTKKPNTLLRRILREAVRVMEADNGSIRLLDNSDQFLEVMVAHGVELRTARSVKLRVGEGVTGWVAQTGKPLRVDDVRKSAHYVELRREVRSELAVPLKVEGRVIGVLNVESTELSAFTEEDEKLLAAVGNQAARVIQTSRLYARLSEQTRRIETLFAVGQALISPDPLHELLTRISGAVLELMDVKLCSVLVLNERREMVLSAVSGGAGHYTQRPTSNGTQLGSRPRQPLQIFDVKRIPKRLPKSRVAKRTSGPESMLSIPIFYHEHLIGMLNIYTETPRHFTDDEMRLLHGFASLSGIAIENSQRYERVLRAEESLRQTERLATLGIVTAEIAHEIRNPINIISMLVHALREERAVSPNRERDIDIIAEKLERIEKIVAQVLGLAKKREPKLERVNINDTLEDLLFLLNHQISAQQIVLRRSYEPEIPDFVGDRGDFEQVFLNLFLNALHAMTRGGILTVRTQVGPPPTGLGIPGKRAITVTLRDTGVGIEPDVIPELFTPFTTTRKEGIGLGLFVSQKLMKNYNSVITVRSTLGRGTIFKVTIPIEETPA